MPIDPRIAMSFQMPQIAAPMELAQNAFALKGAMQQNALAEAKMAEFQQQQSDRNALRSLFAGGKMPEASEVYAIDPTLGASYEKGRYETGEAKTKADIAYWNQQRDVASRIGDRASWSLWRSTLPAEFQQYVPEEFTPDNKRMTLATADKALELHFAQVDTGGGGYTLQMPQIGGPATKVPGSEFTKTLSPAEKARLDAETETGNYSEDSKNLMAALVAQGFPLPIPLGRGSKSDALKNEIYERAGRIAQGLPPTEKTTPIPPSQPGTTPSAVPAASAVDVAGKIGSARQDQAAVQGAIRYYTSGMGNRQITSLNTAVDHLDTLTDLSKALANNDVKLLNRAAQAWKEQTGQAAPVKFDAAKQIVAAEVIKAIVANGGGVTERQEAAEKISRANSPEQLVGVIESLQELLAGQLESIGTQYKATTRRNDFDTRLSDRTKRVLGRKKSVETPKQITSDAEFNNLPSGSLFIGPDGKTRRKP